MGDRRPRAALYPDTADRERFGFERLTRLLLCVRGKPGSGFSGTEGIETCSARVQPHSPGLGRRMWYGGGSLRSARWAGRNGLNFLTGSVVKAEAETEGVGGVLDFAAVQLIVGPSEEIAGRLFALLAYREVDEVAFALPFSSDHDDYVQILTDMATFLGPVLGR